MASPRHEATPLVSELELESAILKGVANHRPIGRHKHVLLIALQKDVHHQTGIWVPVDSLWTTLGDLYDLEALDDMSTSTPSLPASPAPLSPIPHPKRRRPQHGSASPLSSPSPPPLPGPSRSAAVIDSPHFAQTFDLPLGTPGPVREASESASASPTRPSPWDEEEQLDFSGLVYARAKGRDEGEAWDVAVRAQLESGHGETVRGGGGRGRGRGRKSGTAASGTNSRRTSGGKDDKETSPASVASASGKKRMGRPRKRPRETESSEEDKPTPRRGRRRA